MALTGEDKGMRMAGSLGYNNPLENLDQSHHLQPQEQVIQQDKPRGTQAGDATERFSEHDATTAALNSSSGRSKSKPQGGGGAGGAGAARTTTYRECLKNHAASIGGNVTDGCGEFMPSGEEGTIEALKCAACNCHRNFHRKETHTDAIMVHPLHLPVPPLPSPSMNQLRINDHHSIGVHGGSTHWTSMAAQPVKMAFGGGIASVATDSSSEELNFNAYQSNAVLPQPPSFVLSKKRYRTKFTQEQKDKMLEFAEKLGWRIPREDDTEVQRFCAEVGVKRQVFKVWMHNNKNSSAKKNPQDPQDPQDQS